MNSNFFLSRCGVAVCLLSFPILDAAYHITAKPQTIHTQEYCQLPKWKYIHPIYSLHVGAAQQADAYESGRKQGSHKAKKPQTKKENPEECIAIKFPNFASICKCPMHKLKYSSYKKTQ